jgi:hypothetical protein
MKFFKLFFNSLDLLGVFLIAYAFMKHFHFNDKEICMAVLGLGLIADKIIGENE